MNINSSDFYSSLSNEFDFEGLSLINGSIEEGGLDIGERINQIAEQTIITKHFVYDEEKLFDFVSFSQIKEFNPDKHPLIVIQGTVNNLSADILGKTNGEAGAKIKEKKKTLLQTPISEIADLENVVFIGQEEVLQNLIGKAPEIHETVGGRNTVRTMEKNFTVRRIDPEEYKRISRIALQALAILSQQYKLSNKEKKEGQDWKTEKRLSNQNGKESHLNVQNKFPPDVPTPSPKSTKEIIEKLDEMGIEASAARERKGKERKKHQRDREDFFEAKAKKQEEIKEDVLSHNRKVNRQKKTSS